MPGVKTAISLDKNLFDQINKLAKKPMPMQKQCAYEIA